MENYFLFNKNITAKTDVALNNQTAKNLFNSFCFGCAEIDFTKGEKNTFVVGNPKIPELPSCKEFIISVEKDGIAVVGENYGGLMRGFISLLMRIEYISLAEGRESFKIPYILEESGYKVKRRMIHICVFPENDFYFTKKLIRLAGVCQYTHIVIEFWGTLEYDCLKELAWPNAFTKSQAKQLIKEARELGIEPIPMFNQLGHATASRICYGKHVVLDQNPKLQDLFTSDGWAFNIYSKKVDTLLKQVRQELYEVFGDGEYMHIGCDEAYYYTRSETDRRNLPYYLKKLTNQVVLEGRKPMIWMDMLLEENKFPNCYCTCKKGESRELIDALPKETVLVDWQYNVFKSPVSSLESLKDSGHNVIGAPWLKKENYFAHIDTIIKYNLFGVMLTTWHTLKDQMGGILSCAKACGAGTFPWTYKSGELEETATLLRRVSFEGNSYPDSGWAKEQIDI
ncbi:MAG: family 20 glycosylhydrolase [Acutalibacteraceae bacterium]|jgi:hypothetical protein